MISALLFDWGNTVMVDFGLPGPMYTWDKVAWVPGAEKSLQLLSSRFPCCMATNAGASTTPEVLAALKRVGADVYFKHIFLAKEIGHLKPDHRFFRFISEKLSLPFSSLVMIGDHYEKDCIGAKDIGMMTIYYNARQIQGNFSRADAVINHMDELSNAIDKL